MIETPISAGTLHLHRADEPSEVGFRDTAPDRVEHGQDAAGFGVDGVVCRKLRARDLRHLVSNYRLVHIDQPDSLIERGGPLGCALRGLRPFGRLNPITHLAFTAQDRFLAFSQFRQVDPDRRWMLSSIGLANGLFAPERVVEDLLEYSVKRAGRKGVKRVFARLSADCPVRQAFDRVGFEPYSREDLYALDGTPALTVVDGAMREQEQTDTWAVHQLYHAAVPKQVQFAEAWTSNQWDVSNPKRNKGWWRSFVLDEGHLVVAFARVRVGMNTAVVEFMYLPDHRRHLEGFCRGVIDLVTRTAGVNRVFVTIRGHQMELTSVLERIGFSCVRQQELLVKYTAAKVSAKASDSVVLAPADVRERVPKRVPTFLNRRHRERAST